MEALVEANKATFGAIEALAAKQTEILSQAMQGIRESAKGLATEAHLRRTRSSRRSWYAAPTKGRCMT